MPADAARTAAPPTPRRPPPTPDRPPAPRDALAFLVADAPDPSPRRAREILAAHPEVRALLRPTAISFVCLLLLLVAQLALAAALRDAAWWQVLLAAYTAGTVLTTGLFSMIHEASHGAMFRRRLANRLAAHLGNLGVALPAAESFMRYHGEHHAHLGDLRRDVSIPTAAEARWVGNGALRKLAWLAAYPVVYPLRFLSRSDTRVLDSPWMIANLALVLSFDLVLLAAFGLKTLVYLLLGYLFAFGLHPFSALTMQEHGHARAGQESYSYYGPGNLVTFNAGYHLEHHDFPTIPWLRRGRLRRVAPEFYRDQYVHPSWFGLVLAFLRDPDWHLWRRTVR